MAIRITLKYACLLLVSSASCLVGPHDYPASTYIRTRESDQQCFPECSCSSESIQCNGWPSQRRTPLMLPKSAQRLSIRNFPDEHFEASTVLARLTQLRWLRVSDGNLISFPTLPPLPTLVSLDVSGNQILELPTHAFTACPHVIRLNLSGNQLHNISTEPFEALENLRELDLSRNPLLRLQDDFFRHTTALKYLDVSNTNVGSSSLLWTEHLPELHFLNISHNEIGSLSDLSLASLQVLDASHNPLHSLPPMVGFPKVHTMYTSHTAIAYMKMPHTYGCDHLQILDLSHSNLTNLNEGVLSQCTRLKEIDLSHNQNLWRIEHGAMAGLVNLTVLRLNHCPNLYDLEEDVLNGLYGLRELYLQNSGIKVLPHSLSQLYNLTLLNMKNTTLLCDCYAHWVPEFLKTTKKNWTGVDVIRCNDGVDRTVDEMADHIDQLQCTEVEIISESNQWVLSPWGQSALLECNATGNPTPKIIWQTVNHQLHVFNKSMSDHPWIHHQISASLKFAKSEVGGKFQVLQSGQLLVRDVDRRDIGRYKCFAFNAVSNASSVEFLGLDDAAFRDLIIESILFGFACAALFLLITLLVQLINYMMDRLGWECCCCKSRLSPKAKQIRQMIESVESYKTAQLDKLKENYTSQVTNIKDSCYQQMERLRDSYAHQSKNLKDLCDFSTQHITGARDQYLDQVNKVRDYSISQMNRVRENYVFQRHRIRKFSGHQLLRLRETYKYQQKTLNKLLETLPDLYIQNCRTGSCQRTDSIIFEDEIDGLDVYYKVDFLDSQSYCSDYYTPNSTLTRQSKSGRGSHSRNASTTSGSTEYQETHSWVTRQESTGSDRRPHNRSFSIATPPSGLVRTEGAPYGHRRSVSSSSHPSPALFHPNQPLLEETQGLSFSGILDTPSSRGTPLYTPMDLTPVHDAKVFSGDTSPPPDIRPGDLCASNVNLSVRSNEDCDSDSTETVDVRGGQKPRR